MKLAPRLNRREKILLRASLVLFLATVAPRAFPPSAPRPEWRPTIVLHTAAAVQAAAGAQGSAASTGP